MPAAPCPTAHQGADVMRAVDLGRGRLQMCKLMAKRGPREPSIGSDHSR